MLSDFGEDQNRDYFVGVLSLRYWFLREWYVSGGFRYQWQEYELEADDADNESFFMSIGYSGAGRRF